MSTRLAALADALATPPDSTRSLAVGFSGGLDSTSLLHALTRQAPATPLRAIHVCHHLQPEAEAWAAHCRAICRDWGVAFTRLDVTVDTVGRSIEAAARDARYLAIEQALQGGETLVTAHHCQDQAETFLLQALRGAGPHGLAGMPGVDTLGANGHWRPWLGVARDTIREYARHHALHWIDDPSNQDPDLARSFLRAQVMPVVETHWPAAAATLSRAAAHAHEAAQAVSALAAIDLDDVRDRAGALCCTALARLVPPRAKQVVRRWLDDAGLDTPDHRHIEQILALPAARRVASPCVHFGATDVRVFGDRLYCMPSLAPPPAQRLAWHGASELALPAQCGTLMLEPAPAQELSFVVSFRRGGERLLQATLGHRRLKDVLRESSIAPWVRERMPLIHCGDELVLVPGVWRHPAIERVAGVDIGTVIWRHRLLDGSPRVVRA